MWHNELFWQRHTETEWREASQQGVRGGVKLCCSFEISPRLIQRERDRQTRTEKERVLQWLALRLPALFTVRMTYNRFSRWQARSSAAVIIIILPLFWLSYSAIQTLYERGQERTLLLLHAKNGNCKEFGNSNSNSLSIFVLLLTTNKVVSKRSVVLKLYLCFTIIFNIRTVRY